MFCVYKTDPLLRSKVLFALAMAGVLASCAFALGVKICRLMVHTGSTSCAPHGAGVPATSATHRRVLAFNSLTTIKLCLI